MVILLNDLCLESVAYLADVAKLFLLGSDGAVLLSNAHNSLFFDVATLVEMDLLYGTGPKS